MNSQSLYADFKWKQYLKESAQQRQALRIKNLAQAPKINPKSNFILSAKLLQILDQFNDQQIINLQDSIPILHRVHILQILDSLEDIKQKLKSSQQRQRIQLQSRFVVCLWKLIEEQQIQIRQIKQIIFLLHQKRGRQLKQILQQMFNYHEGIQQFLQVWKQLNYNRQYYKKSHQKYQYYQAEKQNNTINDGKNKLYSPLDKNQSQIHHRNPLGQTNSFLQKGLGYSCFLSSDKQKQLIGRLYKNDIYKTRQQMKKQKEELKQKQQLQKCTFKPKTNHNRSRSTSQNKKLKNIKGYEKAVGRLRTGNKKTKQKNDLRQYKPVGENYEKLKEKGINPPKFLNRKKQEDKVLFMISFDLGRYKTNVKIREGDSEQGIAQKLCKIYSLKQDYFDQICKIIRNQLQQYYKQQYEKQIYKDYGAQ